MGRTLSVQVIVYCYIETVAAFTKGINIGYKGKDQMYVNFICRSTNLNIRQMLYMIVVPVVTVARSQSCFLSFLGSYGHYSLSPSHRHIVKYLIFSEFLQYFGWERIVEFVYGNQAKIHVSSLRSSQQTYYYAHMKRKINLYSTYCRCLKKKKAAIGMYASFLSLHPFILMHSFLFFHIIASNLFIYVSDFFLLND